MKELMINFEAYKAVQTLGWYNMYDPKALRAANDALIEHGEVPMRSEDWAFIMKNYSDIKKQYDKINESTDYKSVGDYWDGNGKYQEAYDKIWKEQVPPKGESEIIWVEAVRCMGRLIYEYLNNGNCNATEVSQDLCEVCGGSGYKDEEDNEDGDFEDCYNCDGYGSVSGDRWVSEYYSDLLNKVRNFTKEYRLVREVEKIICSPDRCSFSTKERAMYNMLCDAVMRKAIGL